MTFGACHTKTFVPDFLVRLFITVPAALKASFLPFAITEQEVEGKGSTFMLLCNEIWCNRPRDFPLLFIEEEAVERNGCVPM